MISIDLNCDMGEGMANDAEIMPYISSANIACGYHAGDEETMRRTIELSLKHNVAIGAHPGFNDKENFGRKEMNLPDDECYGLVMEQLSIIKRIANELGAFIHHVKPHGALYNMAAKDNSLASVIAKAVRDLDEDLMLYGLSGSSLVTEAKLSGLQTASEVFADRTYQDDGTLTPRSDRNALIEDEATSLQQVLQMIQQQSVTSVNNLTVPIKAETICIHGDGAHAVEFAKRIYLTLRENNIAIKAI
jgi:UPF0271 protein